MLFCVRKEAGKMCKLNLHVLVLLASFCNNIARTAASRYFIDSCLDCSVSDYHCRNFRQECDSWNPTGLAPNRGPTIEVVLKYVSLKNKCYTTPELHVSPPRDESIARLKGYQVKVQRYDGQDKPECFILDLGQANFSKDSYKENLVFSFSCFKALSSGLPIQISVTPYPVSTGNSDEVHFETPHVGPDPTGLFCQKVNFTSTSNPVKNKQWLKTNYKLFVVGTLCVLLTAVAVVLVVKCRSRKLKKVNYGHANYIFDNDSLQEEYHGHSNYTFDNDSLQEEYHDEMEESFQSVSHRNESASVVCDCSHCSTSNAKSNLTGFTIGHVSC